MANSDEEEKIFDISFDYDGKLYQGWADPSAQQNADGRPRSFHVVLNNVSFGYLSFTNCNWKINEERPEGLTKAVSNEIEKHFQL
ncbi:MAG: hypothetical protein H7Y31_09310 [Chitinophagaceae bacterium]|nr:hypothetical protein [Chitinophagaceae bacterium]